MSGTGYDELAPHYQEYARRRAAYCDAVDRQILEWCVSRPVSMLDVGSGDGRRAVHLASQLGASRLLLTDPSVPMVDQCRALGGVEVLTCAAETLPDGPGFDVISCLWNVLGHVDGTDRRIDALRRMRARLAPDGRIYVDVHNRYNAATAGQWQVARRVVRDLVRPSESNGVVHFSWNVAGRRIESSGYLFRPREMRGLIAAAGLHIERVAFVDYANGATRGPWTGQMLFCLTQT